MFCWSSCVWVLLKVSYFFFKVASKACFSSFKTCSWPSKSTAFSYSSYKASWVSPKSSFSFDCSWINLKYSSSLIFMAFSKLWILFSSSLVFYSYSFSLSPTYDFSTLVSLSCPFKDLFCWASSIFLFFSSSSCVWVCFNTIYFSFRASSTIAFSFFKF